MTGVLEPIPSLSHESAIQVLREHAIRYQFLRAAKASQGVFTKREQIYEKAAGSIDLMNGHAGRFAALAGGEVASVSVKSPESGNRKIDGDYQGKASLLCDPVRATIIIPSDNVPIARAALALHKSVCAVKDQIAKPSKMGLANLNAKVCLDNGLVGEIQLVTPHMHDAMMETHRRYKRVEQLVHEFAESVMPKEVAAEIAALTSHCKDMHKTGYALDGLDRYSLS